MSKPVDIEVKESPEQLLREIAETLRDKDTWKDDFKRGLQNRIDYQKMDSFQSVYDLFKERFFFLVGDVGESEEISATKLDRQAAFRVFSNHALFLEKKFASDLITVSILMDGDYVDFYPIRIKDHRYKVNRDIIDELFREAFHDLIADPYGFNMDAYIVQK